ncbi:MAG TPA: SDR family oxidoreductase [Steroidobacteraceae bacterium]
MREVALARAGVGGALALWLTSLCHAATVLITGANSGIGLEFSKQYAAAGWTVIATHHRPTTPDTLLELAGKYPNVRAEAMDVTDVAQVQRLSAKLKDVPIDVLINNAGVYDDHGDWSTQEFGKLDYKLCDTILAVNVKGPLLVSEAFRSQVRAGKQKKIVSISSSHGTITQPIAGSGAIFYRASKAALNREMRVVADTLKPDGITVVLMHPGAVRTERMTGVSYPGQVETSYSVAHMINTIDALTTRDTGRFLLYDGTTVPW